MVNVDLPSPRVARLIEADRVAQTVAALPGVVHDPARGVVVQQVALEGFFTYARSLIEFLQVKPGHGTKDFSATTDLPGWAPTVSTGDEIALLDLWKTSSQHVQHFSRRRVKDDVYGTPPAVATDLQTLRAHADLVLSVWDQYATAVESPWIHHSKDFRLFAVEGSRRAHLHRAWLEVCHAVRWP